MGLVLDSGAFTAWTKGKAVDIDSYIEFIKGCMEELPGTIEHYANLDSIPGAMWQKPTRDQVEESAAIGWRNFEYMRSQGLSPMPIFHQGERLYWLDKMVAACGYVGISPANDRTTRQKKVWLDEVFGHLTKETGTPSGGTHAFGVTSIPLLQRYPWSSCDSSAFAHYAKYGRVLIPRRKTAEGYNYMLSPFSIFVTDRTAEMPAYQSDHFRYLPQRSQEHILEYFKHVGLTLEQLADKGQHRMCINAVFFRQFSIQHSQVFQQPKKFQKGFLK